MVYAIPMVSSSSVSSVAKCVLHACRFVPLRYWWHYPYNAYKIMGLKAYFHIVSFFLERTNSWCFILCQNIA